MKFIKPDISVDKLSEIDLSRLYERGIRCALIDLDNTISPWRTDNITKDARAFIENCRTIGIVPVLFTNARESRAREAAWKAGISYYARTRKPLPFRYRAAISELGFLSAQVMTVGDQIFTDVLGGNLSGCVTVLTSPLSPVEFAGTRFLRFMEKWVAGRKLLFREQYPQS